MALIRGTPSCFVLLVVGALLLMVAKSGEGFFFNSVPKTVSLYQDGGASSDSENLNEQASYGLEPRIISGDRCASTCSNSRQKFNYLQGNVYQYKYEGDLRTFVTKNEFTGVKVAATALVEVVGECDFVLKLSDVTLEDFDPMNKRSDHSPSSSYFKRALEANPLSFSFDDGVVTSICPATSDEPWTANIKRSILSHLQNSMPSLDKSATVEETDISGVCQTSYEVFPRFVKKSKSLNKCTDSYFGRSLLKGVEYRAKSGALPILRGTQECKQEFSSGNHLTLSTCKEEFVFRPLEGKVSGASTEVTTQLTYVTNYRQALPTNLYGIDRISSSLLFDHSLSEEEISESFSEAQETLRILQQESSVNPSTPELFNKFSKQLKRLDYEKLNRIHTSARTDRAKSFIYDALPLLETKAAVRTMKELFHNVDDTRKSIWITSFAFIQQPSEEILFEAKHFLELSYKEAALSVSSLVYNYLSQKNSNENSPAVVDILNVFLHNLGSECRFSSSEEEQKVLRTLRAIGNAGYSTQVVGTLEACASNSDLPMVIRVAAVEAFRRQSCTKENAQFLETILNNQELDSELRIAAYIQRSKCFDGEFLQYIKNLLDIEEINQVGSFVWTHLSNLANTHNPLKREISKLLKDVNTFKKFDLAENKFSRNVEWSYYHEKSNAGANVGSNLVWSQNSFVPRSLSLNFSVELFGKSVNLIEFGTRVQGIESLLEKTFNKAPKEDNSHTSDDGQIFDSKYQKRPDEPRLGLYIRVFGNELVSEQLNSGLDLDGIKARFNYLNWLMDLAQERQVEFTRSFKILDSSLSLPTYVGLPLKLSVEGIATVTLQAKGKLDILRFMSSPSNLEIGGHFKPSSAVVISGEMGIDSKLIKQGLKIVNTLYSKVVVDGKMELKDGSSFTFDWNTPEDRTDVFSMESRFFIVHRGRSIDKSDESRTAVSELKCLDSSYTTPLGIKPCLEYSFNDLTDVKGRDITSYTPAYFRIYLEKTDTHTGYHLSTSLSKTETSSILHFKVDTPQSRVDRKVSLDFQLNYGNLDIQFYSPWKKFSLQSQIAVIQRLWKLEVLLTVDDLARYELKSEITNNTDHQRQQFNYKIDLTIPHTPTITITGVLKMNERRVDFQANLANFFPQPLAISVNYNHNSRIKKYELLASLSSHIMQLNLKASAERKQPGFYSWHALTNFGYRLFDKEAQTATMIFKINDDSTSNLKSFQTEGSVEFTEFPHLTAQSLVELEYSATTLRSKLELKHQGVRKAFIAQSGILDLNSPRQRINGKLQVDVPSKEWNWQAEYDHLHTESQLISNTSVLVHGRKDFYVNIGVRNNPRGPLNIDGDVEIGLPKGYMFKVTPSLREEVGPTFGFIVYGQFVTPRFTKSGRFEGVYRLVDGSRHEWNVKSRVDGFKPFEISGHMNPNPQNVQLKGAVSYDNDIYGIEAKYVFLGNTYERYNAEFEIEVFYPAAKHSLEVAVTRRLMEFSGYVNVLLKEHLFYKLSTSVTAVPTAPSFTAKVEWPGNFFEVSTLGKYEERGWLTASGELQAQVAIRSSIPGIEELSSTLHASQEGSKIRSTFSVSWSPVKKIIADMKFEGLNLQVNATTPFEGYTSLRFLTQTEISGKSLVQKVEVAWDNEFISVVVDGNANSLPNFEGKVTVSNKFEQIVFEAKNTIDGLNVLSSAELTFAESKRIALIFSSNNEITSNLMINEGKLTLETFFRNLEHQHLNWNRKLNSTSLVSRYEAQVYGKKYQLLIDGSTNLQGNQRVTLGNLELKTPHAGFSNFGIKLNYKQSIDAFVGEGRMTGYLEHQRITVEQNLQFLPEEALIFKLSVDTPFRGYEKLEIDLNNRFDGTKYHAANDIDLGAVGKATLGGSLVFNGKHLDATAQLTTSSRHLEHVSLSLRFDDIDGQLTTRMELDYNRGVVFISSEIRAVLAGREKKFEVDINTSWEQFRTFKFASSAVGAYKHLKLSASVEHNKLPDKISTSFTYDVRDPKKLLLLQYTLATPFDLRTLNAELKHNFQRQHNKYISHGFYEVNRYQTGLSNELVFNTWQDFSTSTKLTVSQGETVLDTSFVYNEDKHLITVILTSPNPRVEKAGLKFQRNGPWNNFESDISLELNSEKVTLATIFELKQELEVKISQKVEVNGVQKATLDFKHVCTYFPYGSGWSNEGHVDINGIRYSGYSQLSWPDRKEVLLKAIVNIPSEYGFSLHHKGDASDLESVLVIHIADETINKKLTFKNPDSETIKLKFTFDSPYEKMENFEFSFNHEGPLDKFVTAAHSTPLFDGYFNFRVQYDANYHRATSELKIVTPVRGQEINFNLEHEGPWNGFQTELTTELAGKTYKNGLEFIYDAANKIYFKTSHSGDENVAFEFTAIRELEAVASSAILTTSIRGYERFSIETRLQTSSSKSMSINGKLITWFEALPKMEVTYEFNNPSVQQKDILLKIDIPAGTISASYHEVVDSYTILVQSPYSGYERFMYKVQTKEWEEGPQKHELIEVELETPIRGFERTYAIMKTVIENHGKIVNITRRIETSNQDMRFIEQYYHHRIEFKSSGELDQAIFIYTTTTSGVHFNRLHASANYTRHHSGFKFDAILQTPFQLLRELKSNSEVSGTRGLFSFSCDTNLVLYSDTLIIDATNGFLVSNEFAESTGSFGANSRRFFVKFELLREIENYFDVSFQASTPYAKLGELLLQLKFRGRATIMESGVTVDYTTDYKQYRISSTLDLGLASVKDHRILLKFDSPFPLVKQFSLAYGVDFTGREQLATLEVKLNDEKKVDFDFKRQTSGDNLVTVNLRSPYQMGSSLSMDGNSGTAVVNWDTSRDDSNVKFVFDLKNEKRSDLTERSVNLTVMTFDTAAGFGVGYKIDARSFAHSLRLYWNDDLETPDFSYVVRGSSQSNGWNSQSTEGSLTIVTGEINHSVGFVRAMTNGHQFTTKLFSLDNIQNRRIALNSDFTLSMNSLKHIASFEHPDFPKEIISIFEATSSRRNVNLKHSLRLNEEVFTIEAVLEDSSSQENDLAQISFGLRFIHPSSNTDVQLKLAMRNIVLAYSLDAELLYKLSQSNQMKKFSLSSKYDVAKHDFLVKFDTPVKSTELKGTSHELDLDIGAINYEILLSSEDLFQVKSILNFNLHDRDLDLKLFTSEYNYYQVKGRLKGISESFLSLNKFESTEENAVNLGWSVNERNFLVFKSFVKPRFWEQWRVKAEQNLNLYFQRSRTVSQQWENLGQELADDAAFKTERYRLAVEPYARVMREWAAAIKRTFAELSRELERMYMENVYHIRDIVDGLRSFVSQMIHCFGRSAEIIYAALNELGKKIKAGFETLGAQVLRLLRESAERLKVLEPHFQRLIFKIDSGLKDLSVRLSALLNEILSQPEVQEFLENLKRLPSITAAELREKFWAATDNFLSNDVVKSAINCLANSIERYKTIYGLIYSTERVNDIINGLRALTTEHFASEKLQQAMEHFFKVSENRWTVWEPETGNYEYQLFVPPRLQQWINFVLDFEYQGITGSLGKAFGKLLDEVRDMTSFIEELYSYDLEKLVDLVPPFRSTASLTGAQHFRTFDGRMFQFSSTCSHLLARDFVNKSFSAFVNYDTRRNQIFKRSITIFTDGRKFEILPDGRVTVDDVRNELPYHYLNTHVIRIGENEVQLVSERGFKLVCDVIHDHCSFTVSGWHHGKLAGLFGTKNYEKADDFMLHDGLRAQDVDSFASSWVAGQCSPDNSAIVNQHATTSKAYEACFSTFNSSQSSFAACYPHEDPNAFMRMCLNEVPGTDSIGRIVDGACRISAAYQRECRRGGVYVRMPKHCVKCSSQEVDYWEGDVFRVNVEPETKSADVVFVIQSGPCNRRVIDRIRTLTENLQKAFLELEDIKLTRYAMVSYGGLHVVPRLHTMDGRVFNAFDKIPRANFDTHGAPAQPTDGMAAIQFAAKLPFRTGSSKTIVFIPCHPCVGGSGLVYPEVHRMIVQSDIKLHALLPDLVRVKSSSSHTKSAFIFGFDDEKVYSKRDVNSELEGDSSMRNFIRMPKDFCAALTHGTNGLVFSSRQWFDTPNQVQRSFVDVFARLIARKAQPTQCQECTCLSDSVGSGFTQCVSCVRRSYFSWINDFLDDDFGDSIEESETSGTQVSPGAPVRPVRPDSFPGGTQRHHTPRPAPQQEPQILSNRPFRPSRAPRPQSRI